MNRESCCVGDPTPSKAPEVKRRHIKLGLTDRAAIYDSTLKKIDEFLQLVTLLCPEMNLVTYCLRFLRVVFAETDLHIVERDLAPMQARIIPGHQIVGRV